MSELDQLLPDLEGEEDQALHELIERAHAIEQLTNHPGWALFVDYLAGISTATQRAVLNGSCKDIEDYRYKTGVVQGLLTAMDAPTILRERVARMQAARAQS